MYSEPATPCTNLTGLELNSGSGPKKYLQLCVCYNKKRRGYSPSETPVIYSATSWIFLFPKSPQNLGLSFKKGLDSRKNPTTVASR